MRSFKPTRSVKQPESRDDAREARGGALLVISTQVVRNFATSGESARVWTESGTWALVTRNRDERRWSWLGKIGDAEQVAEYCKLTGIDFWVWGKEGLHTYCEERPNGKGYDLHLSGEW